MDRINRLIFILLFIFFINISSTNCLGQKVGHLILKGFVKDNLDPLDSISVKIISGGTDFHNTITDTLGRFQISLNYNKFYQLKIFAKDFIERTYEINTFLPEKESPKIDNGFRLNIDLIPIIKNINYDTIKFPTAQIKYNYNIEGFDFDYENYKQYNLLSNKTRELIEKTRISNATIGYLVLQLRVIQNEELIDSYYYKVFMGDSLIYDIKNIKDGKSNIVFEYNNEYLLEIGKKGFVTKKIIINSYLPEDMPLYYVYMFKFATELFKEDPNENYEVYNEPIAMIQYDKGFNDFYYKLINIRKTNAVKNLVSGIITEEAMSNYGIKIKDKKNKKSIFSKKQRIVLGVSSNYLNEEKRQNYFNVPNRINCCLVDGNYMYYIGPIKSYLKAMELERLLDKEEYYIEQYKKRKIINCE